MSTETIAHIFQEIWNNPANKQAFLADPKSYLEARGQTYSPEVRITAHENTGTLVNLVIPDGAVQVSESQVDGNRAFLDKVLEDKALREKLKNDPKDVLSQNGMLYPEGARLVVWEDSATEKHVVLPVNPSSKELSTEELAAVAGGAVNRNNVVGLIQGASTVACGVGALFTLGTATGVSAAVVATLEVVKGPE